MNTNRFKQAIVSHLASPDTRHSERWTITHPSAGETHVVYQSPSGKTWKAWVYPASQEPSLPEFLKTGLAIQVY